MDMLESGLAKSCEYKTEVLIFLLSLGEHKDNIQYCFFDCFNYVSAITEIKRRKKHMSMIGLSSWS